MLRTRKLVRAMVKEFTTAQNTLIKTSRRYGYQAVPLPLFHYVLDIMQEKQWPDSAAEIEKAYNKVILEARSAGQKIAYNHMITVDNINAIFNTIIQNIKEGHSNVK